MSDGYFSAPRNSTVVEVPPLMHETADEARKTAHRDTDIYYARALTSEELADLVPAETLSELVGRLVVEGVDRRYTNSFNQPTVMNLVSDQNRKEIGKAVLCDLQNRIGDNSMTLFVVKKV
jgi:hypothetical protein